MDRSALAAGDMTGAETHSATVEHTMILDYPRSEGWNSDNALSFHCHQSNKWNVQEDAQPHAYVPT